MNTSRLETTQSMVNWYVQFFTPLQVELLNELVSEMISNLNFSLSPDSRFWEREKKLESCIKDLQDKGIVRRYDAEDSNDNSRYNWLLSARAVHYTKFQLAKINDLPLDFTISGWKKEPRPLCPREFEQLKSGTLKMD